MKTERDIYKEKLLHKDSKVRLQTIKELANSENREDVELLINVIFKYRIPNGVALVSKAIGNCKNYNGIEALIGNYGTANHYERYLIMQCLLKLEVFSKFFIGKQTVRNIEDRLYPLIVSISSFQLRQLLSLSPERFEKALESSWRGTKHWRKQK